MKVLVLMVGLAILALAIKQVINLLMSIRAKYWPTTKGSLKKWNMRVEDNSDGELDIHEFQYSYEANGIEYCSEKIGFGFPVWINSTFAEIPLDKALENSPNLVIHYNPKNPSESVLIVGLQVYHLVIAIMCLLAFFGVCIVYVQF